MIVQVHTLTIVQLNVTGDRSRCHCEQKLSGIGATANDRRAVGCKLEDYSAVCPLQTSYISRILGFPELQDAVKQTILSHRRQYSSDRARTALVSMRLGGRYYKPLSYEAHTFL